MQSSRKQTPFLYFILTGILTLVQIILFSQTGSYLQIILLIVFAVLLSAIIFYILFFYIQPKASFFQSSFHWGQVLKTIFLHSNSLLTIKEGQIDQDYFLLNTKPHDASVYIHPDSAASIVNSRGDFRVVSSGFHKLRFGESITTSFPLRMQTISCGPQEGENPFSKRKSGENYTSFHARHLRAQMVHSVTADHQEVFPVFTIQYCLCKNGEYKSETLLDITQLLSQNNMSGPASPAINAIITKQICAYWSARMQKAPLAAFLSGASGNSFQNILLDMNMYLNPAHSEKRPSSTAQLDNKPLAEIAHLKIPFIRIYLSNVWYLNMTYSSQEVMERTI
jgi:hypothetical protein